MHGRSMWCLTLGLLMSIAGAIGAQPQYTITEVPILVEGFAGALGADGGVVGTVRLDDGRNLPALWKDGQTTTLSIDGIALARNASGVNVGVAYFFDAPFGRPMEWTPDGQVFFWDVPPSPPGHPGTQSGQAQAINNQGMAVCAYRVAGILAAARCTREGFELLHGLGGSWASADVITSLGVAAGSAQTPSGDTIVVWATDGELFDYGTLGGRGADLFGLNDQGQFAGAYTTAEGELRAFGGTLQAGLQPLAHPVGFGASAALGLNNHGVRVGRAFTTIGGPSEPILMERAMLWSHQDAAPIDLNTRIDPASGWELRQAISINDAGEILARARAVSNVERVVLLRPILEPAEPPGMPDILLAKLCAHRPGLAVCTPALNVR
jgi:uncharacterized membrane protein